MALKQQRALQEIPYYLRYTCMPFRFETQKEKPFSREGTERRGSRRLVQRRNERARAKTATTLTCSGCPRGESESGLGPRRTCVSAWCRSRSCLAAFLFGWADLGYSSPQQAEFLPTSPTMMFYLLAPSRRQYSVRASPRRGGPVQRLVRTPCWGCL